MIGRTLSKLAWRPRRRFKETLDGVPHERYCRIVGFFEAAVPADWKNATKGDYADRAASFRSLKDKIKGDLERLQGGVDSEKNLPTRQSVEELADAIANDIHNLHLLLGALLPHDALEYAVVIYRDEYRSKVTGTLYAEYLQSEICQKLKEKDLDSEKRLGPLRADYMYLINELRRISLADYHVEDARGELMRKLTRKYVVTVVIPLLYIVFFYLADWYQVHRLADVSHNSMNTQQVVTITICQRQVFRYLALLAYCSIAGATGAYVSALQRIEALPESWSTARSLAVLRFSYSLSIVPVTGLVFALFLSLLFIGGVLTGPLFPTAPPKELAVYQAAQYFMQWENMARFLTWGFIAGFAERLIPDVIDRLASNAKNSDE